MTVTFKTCAAQGDCVIRRIDKLPPGLKPADAENGLFIVAHSETGHHHVIDAEPNVQWFAGDDPMVSYLQVVEATDAAECLLRHLRDYDTHETIVIPPGNYELRRQEEWSPEGWKQVQD